MTTPAVARAVDRVEQVARPGPALARRTVATFIRAGPAPSAPRRPAVPKRQAARRSARASSSSAPRSSSARSSARASGSGVVGDPPLDPLRERDRASPSVADPYPPAQAVDPMACAPSTSSPPRNATARSCPQTKWASSSRLPAATSPTTRCPLGDGRLPQRHLVAEAAALTARWWPRATRSTLEAVRPERRQALHRRRRRQTTLAVAPLAGCCGCRSP